MKSVGGSGLIIIGFLFLYLAISGKIDCFFTFVSCVTGANNPSTTTATTTPTTGSGTGINWGDVINGGINVLTGNNASSPIGVGTLTPINH